MKKCENPACENIVTEYMSNYPNRLKQHCSTSCKCSHNAIKSLTKRKETCKAKYGVENAMQNASVVDTLKQSMMDKYNVENASQLETVKQKKIETCLKNHGVAHTLQSPILVNIIKKTNLRLYGNEVPAKTQAVKDSIAKTNLERRGVRCALSSDVIKDKCKKTMLTRYNVDNWTKSHIPETTLAIINDISWLTEQHQTKTLLQIANETGVSPHAIEYRFKKNNIPIKRHAASYFEKQVYEYVLSIYPNIIQNDRIQIKPFELDVYLPNLNLAFECNGEHWHKEPEKEINKFNMCKEKGIDLHFIWYKDWKKDKEKWKQYIINTIHQKSPN